MLELTKLDFLFQRRARDTPDRKVGLSHLKGASPSFRQDGIGHPSEDHEPWDPQPAWVRKEGERDAESLTCVSSILGASEPARAVESFRYNQVGPPKPPTEQRQGAKLMGMKACITGEDTESSKLEIEEPTHSHILSLSHLS